MREDVTVPGNFDLEFIFVTFTSAFYFSRFRIQNVNRAEEDSLVDVLANTEAHKLLLRGAECFSRLWKTVEDTNITKSKKHASRSERRGVKLVKQSLFCLGG